MIRLKKFLKMSWRNLCKTFRRRFEDVLKTSWKRFCTASWRHPLEDVFKASWKVLNKSWSYMTKTNILVLKTSSEDVWLRRMYSSWIRLEDVWPRRISRSWSRLLKTKTKDVFKMSSRRPHQYECLLGEMCYP